MAHDLVVYEKAAPSIRGISRVLARPTHHIPNKMARLD
jgi:hypothetical protein